MQRNPKLGTNVVRFSLSPISVIISKILGFFLAGFGGGVQRCMHMFQFEFKVIGCLVSLLMLFCNAR